MYNVVTIKWYVLRTIFTRVPILWSKIQMILLEAFQRILLAYSATTEIILSFVLTRIAYRGLELRPEWLIDYTYFWCNSIRIKIFLMKYDIDDFRHILIFKYLKWLNVNREWTFWLFTHMQFCVAMNISDTNMRYNVYEKQHR